MASGPVVRIAVRKLLQSSPSYRVLPPDQRRDIASATTRVASYIADPHGLLSKKPRSRNDDAQARQPRVATPLAPRGSAPAPSPAAAYLAVLSDPRVSDASMAAAALLQTVDFPDFVGALIQGVFNSIVGSSIKQMEAYAELIKQVSVTVDRFVRDGISEAQARDWLVKRFAAQLELDPRGRLRWRVDPQVGACDLAGALSMPRPATELRDLVAAARRRMAVDRQQMLATTVMMGINRVVVTDGSISARAGLANSSTGHVGRRKPP
jgi:hypothetical protein